jgi:hypothetical protein
MNNEDLLFTLICAANLTLESSDNDESNMLRLFLPAWQEFLLASGTPNQGKSYSPSEFLIFQVLLNLARDFFFGSWMTLHHTHLECQYVILLLISNEDIMGVGLNMAKSKRLISLKEWCSFKGLM